MIIVVTDIIVVTFCVSLLLGVVILLSYGVENAIGDESKNFGTMSN